MNNKALGLLGSPHFFGGTGMLLRCALEGAKNQGFKVSLLSLYEGEISPCKGCIKDEEPNCCFPCIFDDYGKRILEEIYSSEVIIFATPVYWYGPSGVMKNLIDRLTCLENMVAYGEPSYMEGKVVGVITVGADAGLTMAGGYLLTVLNAMGAIIPPWAHVYSRYSDKAIEDDRAVMDAINLGLLTTGLVRRLHGKKGYISYVDDNVVLNQVREKVKLERQRYLSSHGETNI